MVNENRLSLATLYGDVQNVHSRIVRTQDIIANRAEGARLRTPLETDDPTLLAQSSLDAADRRGRLVNILEQRTLPRLQKRLTRLLGQRETAIKESSDALSTLVQHGILNPDNIAILREGIAQLAHPVEFEEATPTEYIDLKKDTPSPLHEGNNLDTSPDVKESEQPPLHKLPFVDPETLQSLQRRERQVFEFVYRRSAVTLYSNTNDIAEGIFTPDEIRTRGLNACARHVTTILSSLGKRTNLPKINGIPGTDGKRFRIEPEEIITTPVAPLIEPPAAPDVPVAAASPVVTVREDMQPTPPIPAPAESIPARSNPIPDARPAVQAPYVAPNRPTLTAAHIPDTQRAFIPPPVRAPEPPIRKDGEQGTSLTSDEQKLMTLLGRGFQGSLREAAQRFHGPKANSSKVDHTKGLLQSIARKVPGVSLEIDYSNPRMADQMVTFANAGGSSTDRTSGAKQDTHSNGTPASSESKGVFHHISPERFDHIQTQIIFDLTAKIVGRYTKLGVLADRHHPLPDPKALATDHSDYEEHPSTLPASDMTEFFHELRDIKTTTLVAGLALLGIKEYWNMDEGDLMGKSAPEVALYARVRTLRRQVSVNRIAQDLYLSYKLEVPQEYLRKATA